MQEHGLVAAASINSLNSTMNIVGYSSHDIIADHRVRQHPQLEAHLAEAIAARSSILTHHTKAILSVPDKQVPEPTNAAVAICAFLPYHLYYFNVNNDPPVSYLLVCLNSHFLDFSNHTGTSQ